MTEVKLPAPVKAEPVDIAKLRGFDDDLKPGQFAFGQEEGRGDVIWFSCPCGCGSLSCLPVGNKFKPERSSDQRATWEWDGNAEMPTLSPSIHHIGHWHGWLKQGFFVQA